MYQKKKHKKYIFGVIPLMHNVLKWKNGQTHFKDIAANAARF